MLFRFYLATLEAALEHVTNEQLTFVSGVEEITGVSNGGRKIKQVKNLS